MIGIKSQEYLRDLYRFLRKQENQGVFVINFFNAAGCIYFELPKLKSKRTTQYLENERHYAKDRSVLLIKDKFPDVIDIDNLRAYIEQELNDEKIRDCMSYFAISVSLPENKSFDKLIACVESLNNEISNDESLGDGFCIGHSYFCNLSPDTIDDQVLSGIVEYELIPLLKEYWFDEPTKVKDWSSNLRSAIK